MKLERCSSVTALAEKLSVLGGHGPLKSREWRIRCRLGWHSKAQSAVRHLLYGERSATHEEAKQIEAAYLKHCAERIQQHAAETAHLYRELQSALAAMEASDPEFFAPHIDAVRELLFQRRNQARETGSED